LALATFAVFVFAAFAVFVFAAFAVFVFAAFAWLGRISQSLNFTSCRFLAGGKGAMTSSSSSSSSSTAGM
jgi:hypothetical protein